MLTGTFGGHATRLSRDVRRAGVTVTDVKPTTTDAGALVESDEHSLTVGPDGPVLLQDHYLQRAFQYWRNVDKTRGDRVEHAVRTGQT
jgi:catalase